MFVIITQGGRCIMDVAERYWSNTMHPKIWKVGTDLYTIAVHHITYMGT